MNSNKVSFAFFFLLFCSIARGQYIATFTRTLDNNQAIAADSTEWKFHRALKVIPVSKNNAQANLSIGGEIRQRLRYMDNMNFGDVRPGTKDRDLFWMQRYLLHTDLNVNKNFRLFAQLNSCHVVFKDDPTPGIDVDKLSFMQAFFDIRFGQETSVLFRFGRQDISYGTGYLIGTRDGPNVKQTYDGIFASVRNKNIKGDVFLVRPAITDESYFDNVINKDFLVFSTYLTFSLEKSRTLELYYFGSNLKNALFDTIAATDTRHSMGIRLSNRNQPFNYSIEFTGQIGRFGEMRIRSWQLITSFGYTWQHLPLRPSFESRHLILSGDPDAGDQIVNSFRPISARPPVNEMVPCGSANIILFNPTVQVEFTRSLSLSASYYMCWRYTVSDGIYNLNPSAPRIRERDTSEAASEKLYCTGIYGSFNYNPNQHFFVSLVGCVFIPHTYLKETGSGLNLNATALRFTYYF